MKKKRGKKKKDGRTPRALKKGTQYECQTGYIINVSKVGPHLFAHLRNRFNMDRPDFKRELLVPETGATLRFDYKPPEEEPDKETEVEAWTVFHQFREWWEDFERDALEYKRLRNQLLLTKAVSIIGHIDERNVNYEMFSGDWLTDIVAGGFTIDDSNRKYLYLISEVLEDETDYLKVLELATVEEVTLAEVFLAWDYFQDVLAGSEIVNSIPELTDWRNQLLAISLGDADDTNTVDDTGKVVPSPD